MFAIKADVADPHAKLFSLAEQKTMYGGKLIASGAVIFIFASENEGGAGLVAQGIVSAARPVPEKPGLTRQAPRVDVIIEHLALAKRRLGRAELKPYSNWSDGQAQTELNFKLYRQATNKIVGISPMAAAFLQSFF